MVQSKYDRHSGNQSSGSEQQENIEIKFTPNASFRGTLQTAFGTSNQYGDSLGIVMDDVAVTDGVLYADPEKGLLKLFSWEESTGFSIIDAIERGEEPSVDDALDPLPQTYGDTKKVYELVGGVIEEIQDENGDVLVESQSKARDYEFVGGEVEFGEYEYLDGDPVEIEREVIHWAGASEDGPTAAATRFASLLTERGDDAVVDDDSMEWLYDTSAGNILREDLEGREVEIFMTQEPSEETGRIWYRPTVIDLKTGEPIGYYNSTEDEGDSGN